MPTLEEFMLYMGIDYSDDMIAYNATAALSSAEAFIKRAVGADVFELLPNDPTVTELVKIYARDFYDERSTSAKAGNAKREMVSSMEWQLKLELVRLREEEEQE